MLGTKFDFEFKKFNRVIFLISFITVYCFFFQNCYVINSSRCHYSIVKLKRQNFLSKTMVSLTVTNLEKTEQFNFTYATATL